jgi:PrtD family type I secretion system ABC transporter
MPNTNPVPSKPNPLLADSLTACKGGFGAVILFSMCINVLFLTAPLYMLQVFDRVIASQSTETLIFLTLIAAVALLTLGILESIRTQVMVGLGNWLDKAISGTLFRANIKATLAQPSGPSIQGLRDLSTFRTFLTGPSIFPILDAPWTPIFIAVTFVLHPVLGWLSLAGAVILFSLAILNEVATRGPLNRAGGASMQSLQGAEAAARNANVIEAMGMMSALLQSWHKKNSEMLALQSQASARAGAISATSKFVRQLLQVGVLALGAWLVILGELTPGMMIAGSILMARALAPVEQAIGSWKSAIGARAAYDRVKGQLMAMPEDSSAMALPAPQGRLTVEGVTYYHPGSTDAVLQNINFKLEPGESVGLIGPTAAGKSTLASLIVGIAEPRVGHVRLDGADVATWSSEDLGKYVGYLPQDIELFGGTVRQNIARMGDDTSEAVIEAAQQAGVHELILGLPNGYETEIGEGGAALSGGQRQRIGLARALYNNPRLVVLDEPNASLEAPGEAALVDVFAALKESGTTLVVIAHRPSILRHVDKVLVIRDGSVAAFGPRDEVLAALSGQSNATEPKE